jgi:hypothetical protein
MPSCAHEAQLFLFRNQPALAAELMDGALRVDVPAFKEARIISADLTDIQPAEYRADLVVQLLADSPVLGIVIEVQLSVDSHKQFAWPAYVANLRARLKCPVCLLVVAADEVVARWAARPIEVGGLNQFIPYVLSPSSVPQVIDESEAVRNPELAVLSAMAHGRSGDTSRAAQIALAAQAATAGLDAGRSGLYFDLIFNSLSEAARHALKIMDVRTYEYQSDFARRYVAQGRAEGRAALMSRLLTIRFGPLSAEAMSRIQEASSSELDVMGERFVTARTLEEVLGRE